MERASAGCIPERHRTMKKPLEDPRPPQPDPEADDVMVAAEVAPFLRLNVKTVYEQANAGNLPCWRIGRHFRFSRRALVAHLAQCKSLPHREGE
jgi:excisionase family DNA binding protein